MDRAEMGTHFQTNGFDAGRAFSFDQRPPQQSVYAVCQAVPISGIQRDDLQRSGRPLCRAEIYMVVGPAVGGIIMSYEMARQLEIPNIFAERENGAMTLRRGFSSREGAKVLVVEDVATTGGSVREVMDIVAEAKAEVVGVCAAVDRSGGKIDFGVPFEAAYETEIQSYEPSQCPLCEQGLELVKPGSRKLK